MRNAFLFFLVSAICQVGVAVDDLPPSLLLPTRVVTTETAATASTVTRTEVIDKIEIGVWYVIRSQTPLYVLDSPQGSVSIISSPSSVDGIFAGGDGKPETRVFNQENESVYLIQGLRPVKTELILIPVGVKDKSSIYRQMLTVGSGPKPPPEPEPDPDPEPQPEPEPDPEPDKTPVKSFRVIFVKESGDTLSADQSAIPSAKSIRDYLVAKTTKENGVSGWREYDPQQVVSSDQGTMKSLWEAVKPQLLPAPCLVIEVNGHATIMPFPKTPEECLATLKKFGGE